MSDETLARVDVQNLRELRKALRTLEDKQLQKDLRMAHKRAADMARDASREEAPKRTGALSRTLASRANQNRASVKAGGAKVLYAGPIHFGWPARSIQPNKFIYRAVSLRQTQIIEAYEAEVGSLLKKAGLN